MAAIAAIMLAKPKNVAKSPKSKAHAATQQRAANTQITIRSLTCLSMSVSPRGRPCRRCALSNAERGAVATRLKAPGSRARNERNSMFERGAVLFGCQSGRVMAVMPHRSRSPVPDTDKMCLPVAYAKNLIQRNWGVNRRPNLDPLTCDNLDRGHD